MKKNKWIFIALIFVGLFAAGCDTAEKNKDEAQGPIISDQNDTSQDISPDTNIQQDTPHQQDTNCSQDSDTQQDTNTETTDTGTTSCVLPDGTTYESSASWKHEGGCNDCSCKDGQIVCTEEPCDPPFCTVNGTALAVGEQYYDGCNMHTCNGEGIAERTDRECAEYCLVKDQPFAVGEVVFDGCNFHSCDENGPTTTDVDCFPSCVTNAGDVVAYGDSASNGDERCDCLKFGELFCYGNQTAAEPLCPGPTISGPEGDIALDYGIGDTWMADDACNECKCLTNGEVVCTDRACAHSTTCPFEGESLVPGEVRFDGFCNFHTCETNGSMSKTNNDC